MQPVLVVMPMKMIHPGPPLLTVGSSLPVVANGLQQDGGAAKTLVTHEAQFLMNHLQLIDDGALIFAHLSTPGTVGHPVEVA